MWRTCRGSKPCQIGCGAIAVLQCGLAAGASLVEQNIEEIHAALVDIPCVIDMSHAWPDTWDNLPPPVDPFDQLRAPAPPPDENDTCRTQCPARYLSQQINRITT